MPLFSKIPIDKQQVEKAIFQLEKQTSAELRVYVERKIPRKAQVNTGFERALQIFDELGMQVTEAHNGVLIYVLSRASVCDYW